MANQTQLRTNCTYLTTAEWTEAANTLRNGTAVKKIAAMVLKGRLVAGLQAEINALPAGGLRTLFTNPNANSGVEWTAKQCKDFAVWLHKGEGAIYSKAFFRNGSVFPSNHDDYGVLPERP